MPDFARLRRRAGRGWLAGNARRGGLSVALLMSIVVASGEPPALTSQEISPRDPRIYYCARLDERDPAGPRFDWPGSSITVRFRGTALRARLTTTGVDRLQVVVDGRPTEVLVLERQPAWMTIARDLAPGEHTVTLWKRTEALLGATQLLGLQLAAEAALLDVPRKTRRIEFIGDSITAGYGNEAERGSDGFTPETENNYLAWGSLAARALGADALTLAVSASRLTERPGDDGMPTFYRRTVFLDKTFPWNFQALPAPDAVIVNLGTNDFYQSFPTEKTWTEAYGSLLDFIRGNYPNAHLWLATGPMMQPGEKLAALQRFNAAIVEARRKAGDAKLHVIDFPPQRAEDGLGADGHPSLKTHEKMAGQLTVELQRVLGW